MAAINMFSHIRWRSSCSLCLDEVTITCEACTMMGTPKSLWPVNPIASGTEEASTNSMYAIPFDLLEFLSEIILTSLTYKRQSEDLKHCSDIQTHWFIHDNNFKINWLFQQLRRNLPGLELWFLQQAACRKLCGHLSPLVLDCQLVPLKKNKKGEKQPLHDAKIPLETLKW